MKNSGACTMMVDEQIQSYRISFKLTKPNHSNRAFFGTMKLIINFLCQLRLDLSLWSTCESMCDITALYKMMVTILHLLFLSRF